LIRRVNITLECFKFEKGFHGQEANGERLVRGVASMSHAHKSTGI
jgi:hypothetical protein